MVARDLSLWLADRVLERAWDVYKHIAPLSVYAISLSLRIEPRIEPPFWLSDAHVKIKESPFRDELEWLDLEDHLFDNFKKN